MSTKNEELLAKALGSHEPISLTENMSLMKSTKKQSLPGMSQEQTPGAMKPLLSALDEHNSSGRGDEMSIEKIRLILRGKVKKFLNGTEYISQKINISEEIKNYLLESGRRKAQNSLNNAAIGFVHIASTNLLHSFSTDLTKIDPEKEEVKKVAAQVAIREAGIEIKPEDLLKMVELLVTQIISLELTNFSPYEVPALLEACLNQPTSAQRMAIDQLNPNK